MLDATFRVKDNQFALSATLERLIILLLVQALVKNAKLVHTLELVILLVSNANKELIILFVEHHPALPVRVVDILRHSDRQFALPVRLENLQRAKRLLVLYVKQELRR